MRADIARGGPPHGVFVERKRVVQNVAPEHRWNNFPSVDAVTVDFSARRPARMKVRADFLGGGDANRGREQRVQSALKLACGQRGLRAKACDLSERMHPGVGASRTMQLHIFLRNAPQHIHDFALNRGFVQLHLPAVKVGTVVGDGELEIAHASEELSAMDVRESSRWGTTSSVESRWIPT